MHTDFQAIIFDMDGLLVDSEVVWHIAETDLIESRGHVYTDAAREAIIGMRMDEFMLVLRDLFKLEDSVEDLMDELIGKMLKLIPEKVEEKPGATPLLNYVVEQEIPFALASSSSMSIINAIVESQGWGDIFKHRFTADDDPRGKPAPDVYLRTARSLGYDPMRCLALEDSPNGARAAVAAGMTCYAVPDTSHTAFDAFHEITPHTFDTLHDVLGRLKNLNHI